MHICVFNACLRRVSAAWFGVLYTPSSHTKLVCVIEKRIKNKNEHFWLEYLKSV